MVLPNFLIIGAAKSGTSSIFDYLVQHPLIFGPTKKEPCYFAFKDSRPNFQGPGDEILNESVVTNYSDYLSLFDGVTRETAIGEASVVYLHSKEAPHRIRELIPEVKLIAILRNPVDRAISSFSHLKRDGFETSPSLDDALVLEPVRKANNWQHLWLYSEMGFYAGALEGYYALFPAENIAVFTYDQLKTDPLGLIRNMYAFLGVDESFMPDMSYRHNVSGIPKSRFVHELLRRPSLLKTIAKTILPDQARSSLRRIITRKNITPARIDISDSTRKYLRDLYREDILRTQSIINRDLGSWLEH